MNRKTDKNVKKRFFLFLLSAFISLIIMLSLYNFIIGHNLRLEKNRYSLIAEDEFTHITTTIDCVMARINTLEALIQAYNGNTDFFENVAHNIYNGIREETGVEIRNFAIAPSGVVSKVYPFENNKSLIGFNFMDSSKPGNLEAIRAFEQGDVILTNPFPLIQGGIGMAGRKPVILDNGNEKNLWGLVTVTIDFENLMQVFRLDYMIEMGIDYELSYIDSDGVKHVMKSSGKLGSNPVQKEFAVRNLNWILKIEPSSGWIALRQLIFSLLVIIVLSYFVGMFAVMIYKLRESNEELLKLSITDRLTGCFNRRAYEADFADFLKNVPELDFVYISADINGLKTANDTLGHLVGDELICGTAECLKKHLMCYGKVYRTGGDEFVSMVYMNPEKLVETMELLKKEIECWKGNEIDKLSVSIGFVESREFTGLSVKELSKVAEKRMYMEKNNYYRQNGIDRRSR